MSDMKVTALASWFGSNRMLAETVGEALEGCSWVGVAFGGGLSELPHIKARTILVNDLHSHVINLARVAADPVLGPKLYRSLRRRAFHEDELVKAQGQCVARECSVAKDFPDVPDLKWAQDYFITSWMGRHAKAGTDSEFNGGLSFRWNAGGGDSAAHYHNAVASLPAWRRVMRRANFVCMSVFDFLDKCKDDADTGIYCDPPFPGAGDAYKHKFPEQSHRRLAERVSRFSQARVVMRFYDHPLIRELYPDAEWQWNEREGRKASNAAAPEVLLVKRG